MSALTLDAKFPVIIIAGDFNAAIFQPPWIGANLHGFAEGAEIPALEMLAATPAGELRVTFIEQVGLNVSATRIEVFLFDHEPATLDVLEKVLTNLAAVLPHTPVRAVGCNFHFADVEPEADVVAFFDTPEGLEAEYQLRGKQLAVQIDFDDKVLNFARMLGSEGVRFNFNYHRVVDGIGQLAEVVPGMVMARKDQSAELLQALYKYEEYETLTFASQYGKVENGNETATEDQVVENAGGPN